MSVTIYYRQWNNEISSHALLDIAVTDYLNEIKGEDMGTTDSAYIMKKLPAEASLTSYALIEKGGHGKLYLRDYADVYFSVSHSGGYWMCAVGDSELGLDIQADEPVKAEKLSRRFFHPEEVRFMEINGFEYFCQIWACKESYLKLTGAGLSEGMGHFSVINSFTRLPGLDDPKQYIIDWKEGYSVVLSK